MFSRSSKGNLGVIFIVLLAALPALIWATMTPLPLRFANFTITMRSLGQLAGLVGMALFCVSLFLSARLKWLENYFRGLDRVYVNHHQAGALAFILLMVHPVVLALQFLPVSIHQAALFLIPRGIALALGTSGLLLMMLLLVLTLFKRPAYHIWKYTHKFLGLAFIFGLAHMWLIESDTSRSNLLLAYMSILGLLALSAHLYRTILPKLFVYKYTYRVAEVKPVNAVTTEIILVPEGKRMSYLPGQFIFISFLDSGLGREEHPFSIASADQNMVRIIVKNLGDYTKEMTKIKAGTLASIEGPFGRFSSRPYKDKDQLWVAGGIGITPFLGMARDLVNLRERPKVMMVYSVRNHGESLFANELDNLAGIQPNFFFSLFYSDDRGKITADYLSKQAGDITKKEIFLCGPLPMMQSLREGFIRLGVDNKQIHSEEFGLS